MNAGSRADAEGGTSIGGQTGGGMRPTGLGAPLWSSGFRPFYLLGTLFGLLVMATWTGAWLGAWPTPPGHLSLRHLHGHEMIFGFAAAIVVGITLTALPSWPHTPEVRGAPLAVLVGLWLAGRLAIWGGAWLAAPWRAGIDLLFFPAVFAMVAAPLLHASNRLYLLLLPILLALFGANLAWHLGMLLGNEQLASNGLLAGLYALMVLFVLKGGLLTPIFTGNALRASGRGDQAPFLMALDSAAVAAIVVLAGFDLGGAPANWTAGAALACVLLNGWRVMRWRGWRVSDVPLVFAMHLGFAWLLLAFALKAAAALGGLVPELAWVHAFTIGSLGLMMLALMTRVVLRHTGRVPQAPPAIRIAFTMMFAAALLRLAAHLPGLGSITVTLAALLWLASFAVYLRLYAHILVQPSLAREVNSRNVPG